MREVIEYRYVFCIVCLGRAVRWNCQDCNWQTRNKCKALV